MKHVMLCLLLTLSASAQVPAIPDVPGSLSSRKALQLPGPVLPHAPFEFRGIRIGDPIAAAERTFLAWKPASPFAKPGLCGSDGIRRIETCTDVLDTGEYVNVTLSDERPDTQVRERTGHMGYTSSFFQEEVDALEGVVVRNNYVSA